MNNRVWKSFVLVALVFCLFTNGNVAAFNREKAAEFLLKDQYGNQLSYKFPKDKVSVLAFADRNGSEQLEGWIRPLVERYDTKIDIHGVAELSAVPGIARGIVRGIMKREVKYSVLLDWSGDVSKNYKFQKDKANIFVIGKQGNIISRRTGTVNSVSLANLYQEIDGLMR